MEMIVNKNFENYLTDFDEPIFVRFFNVTGILIGLFIFLFFFQNPLFLYKQ